MSPADSRLPAATSGQATDPAPSLFRELADGTAGWAVKIFVALALAPLLAGVALLGAYVLACWVPGWNRYGGGSGGYVSPDDDLVGWLLGVHFLLYLAAIAWIATRNRRKHRVLWGAALLSVGIVAATIILGILMDELLGGGAEVVIGGLVCLAGAGVTLVWVQAGRRYARGVPTHDPADGALDVRCPTCGYRMVGLHESRCPECGTGYTLDELLSRQAFLTRTHRRQAEPTTTTTTTTFPPPPPPLPVGANGGAPRS